MGDHAVPVRLDCVPVECFWGTMSDLAGDPDVLAVCCPQPPSPDPSKPLLLARVRS